MTSTEGPSSLQNQGTDEPKTNVTEPQAGEQPDLTKAEKKLREKEQKRIEDERRRLDSWERYRALNDAMDEAYELIDIANREARFSLILMGALNLVLFVVGTRTGLVESVPSNLRPWITSVLVVYALVALYFFLQAIETLRPRRFRPRPPEPGRDDSPVGVRYYEDIIDRDAESYWQAWREIRIDQLNAELASQVHSLALKNKAKYMSLRRLYSGLRLMTVLVAILLILLGYFFFMGIPEKPITISSLAVTTEAQRSRKPQPKNLATNYTKLKLTLTF